jgi:transcriptional regulator with XRE-family HTH domain
MENGKPRIPEWAREIRELRKRLGLSQAALGQRLQYSPVAVSRWERGAKEPTAEAYIRLGHLGDGPALWSFWSRAGLRTSDIARTLPPGARLGKSRLPEFEIVLAGGGKRAKQRSRKLKIVAIPVLPVRAATLGESGDRSMDLAQIPAEAVIAAPVTWNPNSGTTSCLRVKGASMHPAINDGDLVAVDASLNDPDKLNGKIVVALHQKHGLLLGRFRRVDAMQMLESENREYGPLVLGKGRDWRILGKVLWLFRQTP